MAADYIDLIESDVKEENFVSRFDELQKQINEFLASAGYVFSAEETDDRDGAECVDRILYHVLLDFYSDLRRLKAFHDIEHEKTDKDIAYLSYWILRRKPIQINNQVQEDKDIFINERFVCYMILNECLQQEKNYEGALVLDEKSKVQYSKYIDLLLYFFKYREYSAHSIELMIETFKMGILFGKVIVS